MDELNGQDQSPKASTDLEESIEAEREKLDRLVNKYGFNHSVTYQQSCLVDVLVLKVLRQ